MSIRNLEFLFKPKSVAVVGASRKASSVGAVLARNLLRAGFDGPVMPVNLEVLGRSASPPSSDAPATPFRVVTSRNLLYLLASLVARVS